MPNKAIKPYLKIIPFLGSNSKEERKPNQGDIVDVRNHEFENRYRKGVFVAKYGDLYIVQDLECEETFYGYRECREHQAKLTHKEIEEKLGHPFIYKP